MRVYFDYNATTPLAPEVIETVTRSSAEVFGNASSIHRFGQQAKAALDEARSAVATVVGGDPSEVVFTSGGTESDNFAIRGAAEALEPTGRRHLIAGAIEHEAVLNTVKALARRGWRATLLPVDASGVLSPDSVREAISDDTAIVSVMHANNEIGTIQPIAEVARLAHAHGALVHTDAVQSTGKIPVDVRALDVDLLSLSAHKFNGPKGAGVLWIKRGTRMQPTMTGGKHERNRRAGTENVPAIAGLGVAARLAEKKLTAEGARVAALRDRLEQQILAGVPGTAVNGARDARVPNTTNISFARVEAESLLIALDLEGVAVSTGSACSSGTLEPSHVLKAMGLPPHRTQNSLRFSLGLFSTEAEVDYVAGILPRLVEKLRTLNRKGVEQIMRIVVAMSGGVDSSVAAALLAEEGHDVIGVSMQLYDQSEGQTSFGSCCSIDDLHDARRVAAAINIPHYILNFERQFDAQVVSNFVREYAAGRTPLPCAHCNSDLKFATLADHARGFGADAVATGHYARVDRDPATGRHLLKRGVDPAKDQSYFLFSLTQAQLAVARFPVGDRPKDAVREYARQRRLPVADKPDSQEICFIPDNDYRSFVERQLPGGASEGVFVDEHGRVLGSHDGIHRFTVGQRKGLGLASSSGTPVYVLALRPAERQVVVRPKAPLA